MRKLELGEACHSCFDIFFDLYLLLVGVQNESSTTGSAGTPLLSDFVFCYFTMQMVVATGAERHAKS